MKRFILIILDGFGIGYMDDVYTTRPQDVGSNTCRHILEKSFGLRLPNMEYMGLMNSLGDELGGMKKSLQATFGSSNLSHFGADTFYGHQEIMGTKPLKPVEEPFYRSIDRVCSELVNQAHDVKYMGDNLKFLLVDGCVTVADNIEADLGQAYNITAPLDVVGFKHVLEIGRTVRNAVRVSRVIAFGGEGVTIENILSAVEEKENEFIGINAPRSGVYKKGYQVVHMGYGINTDVQVPAVLGDKGIDVTLIGKAADIIENQRGRSIPCVDTEQVMELVLEEMKSMEQGFIAANVQETDLEGHAEDINGYADRLKISDNYIGEIMKSMENEDLLLVMADHGNDPAVGHSHHTRERVPILIYGRNIRSGFIGCRRTLSDVGATVTEFFNCKCPENGVSFLRQIVK